jgi:hypothetical protein
MGLIVTCLGVSSQIPSHEEYLQSKDWQLRGFFKPFLVDEDRSYT